MDIFIRMLWKAPRALPAQRQIVLGRRCVVAPSAAKQSALPGPGGVVQPQRWRGLLRVATEKTVVHFSVSRNFSPRAENRGCCCGAAQEWWCADESNKWSDAHHGGGGSRRKAAEGNRLGNGFTSVLLFHSLRTYGQIDRFQVDFKWEEEEEGGGGGGWWRRRVLGWSGGTKINTISKPPMWPVSIAKHFTPAPTQPRKHTHTHYLSHITDSDHDTHYWQHPPNPPRHIHTGSTLLPIYKCIFKSDRHSPKTFWQPYQCFLTDRWKSLGTPGRLAFIFSPFSLSPTYVKTETFKP